MKKILYSVMALAITAMTFTACEDVPEPYPTPTPTNGNGQIEGATGDGTLENPFNAVAATNAAKALGSGNVSEQVYYIKGKVVSIATDKNGAVLNFDQGTYGNASFYISDDGTSTNQFYCYRVLYLGHKKWTAGAGDLLKVGDEVIVCAKLTLYNTTPETNQNDGYLYSLNGKTESGSTDDGVATGDGTLANPFNAVAATNTAKALGSGNTSDKAYYIKGKVASIATDKNGNVQNFDFQTYGNATFYISDDGTSANQFYCYQVLYLGNKKWTQGAGDILKVGDDVIVCAKLTMYNTTPETQKGEGYLYSLNGQTEGGDTPNPQPTGNYGTAEAPLTVAQALEKISGFEMKGTSPEEAYVKGVVVSVESYNSQYKSLTYWISDDGTENGKMEVYSGKGLNGADFTATTDLHKGAVVVVKGILKKFASGESYVPEFDKNSVIISITNNEGGNDNPTTPDTPSTGEGSYAQPFSVANVIAKGTANSTPNVYVKAYIVGWVEGQVLSNGAKFNSEGVTVDTNILIADAANEGDVTKCVPVQLPKGAIRTGLNLKENPGLLGKQVILYGNLEKYFGAAGIKSVSYAECNGNSIGTKP